METRTHVRRPTKPDRALLEPFEDHKAYQVETTTVRSRQKGGY